MDYYNISIPDLLNVAKSYSEEGCLLIMFVLKNGIFKDISEFNKLEKIVENLLEIETEPKKLLSEHFSEYECDAEYVEYLQKRKESKIDDE